ncbi:hypothetical protein MAPG_08561, partial [Magnaporthiopsis poae ATCC 64411]
SRSATPRPPRPPPWSAAGRAARRTPARPGCWTGPKKIRFSKEPGDLAIRSAVEAWNLADTEAWRFARAFVERSVVERRKWEEEESKYAGGAGSDKNRRESPASGPLGRWLEKV